MGNDHEAVGACEGGLGTSRRRLAGLGPTALARGLLLGVLTACPGPDPDPAPEGPCTDAPGDPVLELANRGGGTPITDGAEVEVFPPPQGGVFTELDVTIEGLDPEELDALRITIVASDGGRVLADVSYFGDLIPLRCTEDEVLALQYMPVGFLDPVVLDDLDGVAATLTGTLETTRGDVSVTHAVVLRATEY